MRTKYLQRYADGSIFFRKSGKVLGRMPDDETSKEFAREYDRHLATIGKTAKPGRPAAMAKPKNIKVTISTFVERYRASDFFAHPLKPYLKERPFAAGTQNNYRLGLDLMHRLGMTAMPFSELTTNRARLYIAMVKRQHGGAQAAQQKALLSNLWVFASDFPDFNGGDRANPMKGDIKSPYTVKQEHLPWPQVVQDKFVGACDANLYRAFHLLICTGQRVSDVATMKRAQYDAAARRITLARGQKKDRTSTPMTIPVSRRLEQVLALQADTGAEYLLTHKWGRPYGSQSLSLRIREKLREIGEPEFTTHGLRKNAGIYLAENGATVPQIMAALGHRTPKMALYYCRLANQALLADQVADILDRADAKHEATRIAKRRGAMKIV